MGKVRKWKEPAKERGSAIVKGPRKGAAWEKKAEERSARRQMLLQQRALNDEIAQEKRDERLRIEEKRKRREANRAMSGKLQVIKDPKKIKKMSKKQLRMVTTADTTGVAPVDKGTGREVVASAKRHRGKAKLPAAQR
eukprot:CAMPEP_0119415474 /NCGR_PEP_ID=MMETSP1335-20130426/9248_1 /TAXON_ID=259385 /ORGANISM="Chrysoculter rhomboideus, Strain RCC1486" /LENGTH=137 /DNA_ID=CAMNT_0007440477 /DNA_START=39 /DNA_END=452 /DNA_ORIENTATION=-